MPEGNAWLRAWNPVIPASTDAEEAAFEFPARTTSEEYIESVAASRGWAAVTPGTRQSTCVCQQYRAAAPFAEPVLGAILKDDPDHSIPIACDPTRSTLSSGRSGSPHQQPTNDSVGVR